jgi:hypothetical protein
VRMTPSPVQREIVVELADQSDRIVALCATARQLLEERYGIAGEKIAVIPHGIADTPFVDSTFYKDQFGLEGRTVLMTFGLLSPGKGIETVIRALPKILERYPEVVYIVLGATHPNEFKREGNSYVTSLERLAARLGVRERMVFHKRYVSTEELLRLLSCADIYVTPYLNMEQIVSGTLSIALGMGKAVISTPYLYAEEMLAGDRGVLFPIGDSEALAARVIEQLDDPVKYIAMRKRAYIESRAMVWNEVAQRYLDLAESIVEDRQRIPRHASYPVISPSVLDGIPEINLSHLMVLTDDTGIIQHSLYTIPDRTHGYCTDDNARALQAAVRYYALTREVEILALAKRYMSFIHSAFDRETRRFRNFLSYERRWIDEKVSEDTYGQCLRALAEVVALAPTDQMLSFALRLFSEAIESAEGLASPRAWALTLVGIHSYLRRFGGDALVRRIQTSLSLRLLESFQRNATDSWPWCEDVVTYANGVIPHALIQSGRMLGHEEMIGQGMRCLEWLVNLQLSAEGTVSLIGNQGWFRRGGERARFDQQPVDALALVEASIEAWKHVGDRLWRDRIMQFQGWFLGNNDTQSILYDSVSGGCRDGLQPNGPNLNEGAESTLAWLLSLLAIHAHHREWDAAAAPGSGKGKRGAGG